MTPEERALSKAQSCGSAAHHAAGLCFKCAADAIRAAVEEEREACAKVCEGRSENLRMSGDGRGYYDEAAEEASFCAERIRARETK